MMMLLKELTATPFVVGVFSNPHCPMVDWFERFNLLKTWVIPKRQSFTFRTCDYRDQIIWRINHAPAMHSIKIDRDRGMNLSNYSFSNDTIQNHLTSSSLAVDGGVRPEHKECSRINGI